MSSLKTTDDDRIELPGRASRLAEEIAQLAGQELAPEDFYQELLWRLVEELDAIGGAVWLPDEEGRLQLVSEHKLDATGLLEDADYKTRHSELLAEVLSRGKGAIINQRAAAGPSAGAAAEEMVLLFGPLRSGLASQGLLEIFHVADAASDARKGLLRTVLRACEQANAYHAARSKRESKDRQALWGRLETFTRAVHAGLNVRDTAYTIVNEGRRLIGCDRVSVGILRGRKCRIEAISGQDQFDHRANLVRRLGRLSSAVTKAGEPLWYAGDTRDVPPQIERSVQAYADESQSKMVAVLPLYREVDDVDHPRRRRRKPLGALIVEQIEDTTPREGFRQRVEAVRDHSGLALGNALEYRSLFLLPLWRFLGKLGLVVRFRTLPKTILALALLASLVAALVMVPYDFDLEGRGTLQPVMRQDVFAGIEGQVLQVLVKHLDAVSAGQPLAVMRSTALDSKITELEGQIQAKLKEQQKLETLRISERRNLTPLEAKQLTGRKQEIEATLASLRAQISLHMNKRADLVVRSPIDGAVTTLDVRNRLIGRPVQRGDTLLGVANLQRDWELEVRMPEDRMGHILQARQDLARRRREQPGADLPADLQVRFILATDPGVTFEGVVKEIHRRAEVRDEEGNTVLLKVTIDKKELPQLRPGASVIAKVHCGQRSLGFVWFHDVIEFVQSRILFRF